MINKSKKENIYSHILSLYVDFFKAGHMDEKSMKREKRA